MAHLQQQKPTVEVTTTLVLNERELRALNALTVYGTESFLGVFYKHLGSVYLKPHEDGLIELFESIKLQTPSIFRRADAARKALKASAEDR
jgi:hypothetical protein